ncbi:MAG: DNA polymerase-3 subunit gamma/tau [Bradymonadia bacterium]|jgi:DNA polymerase-3 subunit gamma/tau
MLAWLAESIDTRGRQALAEERMSYLVLARKWRPTTFDEVVGQAHVTRTLSNALSQQRVAHALLFTGSRGIGKTSCARILAKALNCDEGPTVTPCGVCPSCIDISAGKSTDVFEIDGASNNSVEQIREIREAVKFVSTRGKRKIYIIDEVHMLSTAAFNALLKTLEEPPPHVLFIFATTEPHKIPETIVSRCQRFDFKRIPQRAIVDALTKIARAENIEVEPAALQHIARESKGGMRDSLSLLDQVIAFCGTKIIEKDARQILGIADRAILHGLTRAILDGDGQAALNIINDLFQHGIDLQKFATEFVQHLRDLMVIKVCAHPDRLIDIPGDELAMLAEQVAQIAPARIHRLFNALIAGAEEVSRSNFPKLVFEMTLLKLCEQGPTLPLAQVLEGLARLEARIDAPLPPGAGPSGAGPSGAGPSASGLAPSSEHGGGADRTRAHRAPAAQPRAMATPPPAAAPQQPIATPPPAAAPQQPIATPPPAAAPQQPIASSPVSRSRSVASSASARKAIEAADGLRRAAQATAPARPSAPADASASVEVHGSAAVARQPMPVVVEAPKQAPVVDDPDALPAHLSAHSQQAHQILSTLVWPKDKKKSDFGKPAPAVRQVASRVPRLQIVKDLPPAADDDAVRPSVAPAPALVPAPAPAPALSAGPPIFESSVALVSDESDNDNAVDPIVFDERSTHVIFGELIGRLPKWEAGQLRVDGHLLHFAPDAIVVRLAEAREDAIERFTAALQSQIETAFAERPTLDIQSRPLGHPELDAETVAAHATRLLQAARKAREDRARNHPAIAAAARILGAEVERVTVPTDESNPIH